MYLKIFLNSILVLLIFVLQVSFISSLPGIFSNINILLIFLVYLLIISDLSTALIYAISFGFLMDNFSFYFFGTNLFSLAFSIFVVNFLLVNFFTNRSLYAFLGLITSASVLNLLFTFIFNNFFSLFSNKFFIALNEEYFLFAFKQLALNFVFMILIFYLTNFLNNRFRPVFLVHKKMQ